MMIRSVGYALSWEYWRRGMCWFVPACAILVVALMAPAYGVLTRYAEVRAELNHAVFGLVCWGPLVMALASRGFLRRQYTLPLRTGTFVGWTLANGSLAVAIAYWLVALGFNTLFDAGWPFWGPACWAVMVYACFQAAVWSVTGGRSALVIGIVYLALLTLFAGPPNLRERLVPAARDTGDALIWPTMSAAELAALLAVVAGSCLAAVYVVGRDRRGDAWTLAWLSPAWWMHRIGDRVSAAAPSEFTPRSFRSPLAAQFWMEWRSKGRYVVLYVVATVAVLWVFTVWNRFDRVLVSGAVGGLMALLLVTPPLWGLYLGHRSERFDMKAFLGTRPMSDGDMAMAVLRHAGFVCVLGAIMWLIGVFATVIVCEGRMPRFSGPSPTWYEVASALLHTAAMLAGYLLLVWTLVGLGASLAMARSWFVAAGGFGAVALLFLAGPVRAMASLAASAASILLVAGCLGGTVTAFVAARQRKLVSNRTVLGAVAVYVLIVACIVLEVGTGVMTLEGFLYIVGFSAAPLVPLAAAPLALAWNRHR